MEILEKAIKHGLKIGGKFVEARYELRKSTSLKHVDGILKDFSSGHNEGVSIRIFIDGSWGFSSTNKLDLNSVYKAVETAYKISKANLAYIKEKYKIEFQKTFKAKSLIRVKEKFEDVPLEEKISLIKNLDSDIKNFDKRIKSRTINYVESQDVIHVLNSFGTNVYKEEYYLFLNSVAFSFEAGIRGRGYEAIGGTGGYEIIKEKKGLEMGKKVAEKSIEQLSAKGIKPGKYTCIIDPILAGVFAHEGIGHPSEADTIVEKNSVLEGKIGEKIASELVTIIDDPLIEKTFGYFEYDFEGFPAKKKYIIEKGFLKEYLHNLETSSILKMEPNGASRADSFLNEPIVRMSNIYFEKGNMSFDELIKDINYGIYAKGFEYGYVVPSNGQYTFKCASGYLIEKGEIKNPIRDLSLSGIILETLKNVDGLGKDLKIEGVGYCGKENQIVRVGDGGPHVRVKNIVVGGVA